MCAGKKLLVANGSYHQVTSYTNCRDGVGFAASWRAELELPASCRATHACAQLTTHTHTIIPGPGLLGVLSLDISTTSIELPYKGRTLPAFHAAGREREMLG